MTDGSLSLVRRAQRAVAAVVEIVLVGFCLSAITVLQQPDADTLRLYALLYVVFSNGVLVWGLLSVLGERPLSRLTLAIGELTVGNVRELVPLPLSDTVTAIAGSTLAVVAAVGALGSGLLDGTVVALLSWVASRTTVVVTQIYWAPTRTLWANPPVSLGQLYQLADSNAGSLAAAGAVTLSELIDSTTATDAPDERL